MEGKSLIFLLDDGRLDLNTSDSYNTDYDMMDRSLIANVRYQITRDQLEKINNSEKEEFRIILDSHQLGEAKDRDKTDQNLDGRFNKKNRKVWNEFYTDYIITIKNVKQ